MLIWRESYWKITRVVAALLAASLCALLALVIVIFVYISRQAGIVLLVAGALLASAIALSLAWMMFASSSRLTPWLVGLMAVGGVSVVIAGGALGLGMLAFSAIAWLAAVSLLILGLPFRRRNARGAGVKRFVLSASLRSVLSLSLAPAHSSLT